MDNTNLEFTLGISLGDSLHNAITTLYQSLGVEYSDRQMRFLDQWDRPYARLIESDGASADNGSLIHASITASFWLTKTRPILVP